jgi:hypothetical protein
VEFFDDGIWRMMDAINGDVVAPYDELRLVAVRVFLRHESVTSEMLLCSF